MTTGIVNLYYSIILLLFFFTACQPSGTDDTSTNNRVQSAIPDNAIINLYDAFGKTQEGLVKDFGFSALIRYNGKTILFDGGTNADILKRNTEGLGVDLRTVDFAVGSHAHGDHLNGFDYLLEVNPDVKIYLPFDLYVGANVNFNVAGKEESVVDSLPEEMQYFSGRSNGFEVTINQTGRFWKANAEYVKSNTQIMEGVRLIATQSPYLGYGSKYPSVKEMEAIGVETQGNDGITFAGLPELSLALATQEGEVLVVGCSHSSVQNIIRETKNHSGNEISLLFGGYHMLPYGRGEINQIADQLKNDFEVKRVAPAHCTGHLAFKILKDTYDKDYLFAGLGEIINL